LIKRRKKFLYVHVFYRVLDGLNSLATLIVDENILLINIFFSLEAKYSSSTSSAYLLFETKVEAKKKKRTIHH